jgi:hypothetical protein
MIFPLKGKEETAMRAEIMNGMMTAITGTGITRKHRMAGEEATAVKNTEAVEVTKEITTVITEEADTAAGAGIMNSVTEKVIMNPEMIHAVVAHAWVRGADGTVNQEDILKHRKEKEKDVVVQAEIMTMMNMIGTTMMIMNILMNMKIRIWTEKRGAGGDAGQVTGDLPA